MSVPDTTTFTLQNVIDEVRPTINSLLEAFADAHAAFFDASYQGSKNQLDDFRNYGNVSTRIICNQASFALEAARHSKDYVNIGIAPVTMAWTAALEDTGDGTSWCSLSAYAGTGSDVDFYANALSDNGPTQRSCQVRFTDDSSSASDLVMTVIQAAGTSK